MGEVTDILSRWNQSEGVSMSITEEIMLALRFFFDEEEDENVNEIIGQDHDPIGTHCGRT
jgi:hypothetical protein